MSDEMTGQGEQDVVESITPAPEEELDHVEPSLEAQPAADSAPTTSVESPVNEVAPVAETSPEATMTEAAAEIEVTLAESLTPDDDAIAASDGYEEVEEIAPEAPAEETPAETGLPFKRGDLIEGVIVKTTPIFIEVDLGEGIIGVVPGRELERMTRKSIAELEVGQQIAVFVVNPRDHQGNTVLSINRALEELDWKQAETYRQSQETYDGRIAGYNKGGLIVRFGRLRGFVPQSQISEERRRSLEGETPELRYSRMVNEEIIVKVMEVDRSRNRLILSERAASRERREKRKAGLIKELVVGEIREGRVVSLEDFGAFVDIGGAEGLVHLTEISWRHIVHPREVLEIGQTVKVEVISIDPNRKRIGLSIKRQKADPWDEVATAYQEGDLVQGVITKLTKFGAFAQLTDADNIEGLVHISELSDQRVKHPREVVQVGEKLTLRVVKVDVKNRRLGLSLKRVNSAEYLDRDIKSLGNEPGEEQS